MAIFFGGSSLIVQQKLIDYYSLYDSDSNEKDNSPLDDDNDISMYDYDSNDFDLLDVNNLDLNQKEEEEVEEKEKEDEKTITKEEIQKQSEKSRQRNFKSLFVFTLANLVGYTGKYGIAIIFTHYQQSHIISNNQTIYNNTEDNLYLINPFNSNNTDILNMNDTNITSLNYELNKNIFIFINVIYIGCKLISVIFYSFLMCCFFENKKRKKKNRNVVVVTVVYGILYVKYVVVLFILKELF